MIAIKDMEMPKCCHWDCPLCNEDGGACMLDAYDSKADTKKERASNCPLVEIVTCKDCIKGQRECSNLKKYCVWTGRITEDDFYCKDGKRRK